MVFTGLVQQTGRAVFDMMTNWLHVKAPSAEFWAPCAAGDSIAINGCCLTILYETKTDTAMFFVMEESRTKTNLANLVSTANAQDISSMLNDYSKSVQVNMERALRVGDPLGGHTVTGHIDGVIPVVAIDHHSDGSNSIWLKLPANALIVHKGSITLDGISLTVAELKNGNCRVSIIPHTWEHTTLNWVYVGRLINVEFDQALKLLKQLQSDVPVQQQTRVVDLSAEQKLALDEARMKRAIELGELGKETAAPNPWVGCVITDEYGNIIGEGYHQKAGQAHAEIRAIKQVKDTLGEEALMGATCYTTLEPCSHTGRTGPCDQQLLHYKFARVVTALTDPDTKVSGTGIQHLISAGVEVVTGIGKDAAAESLRPYLHHRITGRPWVVLKMATSMDAKIAPYKGASMGLISSDASRFDVHKRWRASSQAVLVGSGTAELDNPMLTTRAWYDHVDRSLVTSPLRVVIGAYVELGSNLLDTKQAPTLVFTSGVVPQVWEESGVEAVKVSRVQLDNLSVVDFYSVLEELGKRGVLQVLVEGGAKLSSSLLKNDLVNQLVIYQTPAILGPNAKGWSNHAVPQSFKLSKHTAYDSDVCLEYLKA